MCDTSADKRATTALKAPARYAKSHYHPIGRRVSIGNRETLPKRASALEINRRFLSHRLRSYYAQLTLEGSMVAASKPSAATA